MGEESIELVRRVFDAFARRDVEAVIEVVDPAVEFFAPTASIAGHETPYRGHTGMRQYFEDVARIWEVLEVIPHEIREVEGQVAHPLHPGRGLELGQEIHQLVAHPRPGHRGHGLLGYRGPGAEWPSQYLAGSAPPPGPNTDRLRPRLSLTRQSEPSRHQRWLPEPEQRPVLKIAR